MKLDFRIDKLTNSIENAISGESIITFVTPFGKNEFIFITKKNNWLFNWKYEFEQNEREVYKLTIKDDPSIIQGLMSITKKADHVFINLIESSPFNRGKNKLYLGVPGNLVAFACRISFRSGYEGFVAFYSKSNLINHYRETLGAKHAGGKLMIIESENAKALIEKYFNK